MRLNILNGRSERYAHCLEQVKSQAINAVLWDSVYLGGRSTVKETINASHKQIVRYAQLAEWEYVQIAEDDIVFTKPYSCDYYMSKMPEDFDIYLGMVYLGDIDENSVVKDFTGLTLYTVHRRFYDTFLSVPDDDHLDRLLSGLGVYKVCQPFVCKQLNGFSSNTGKMENYDELLKSREFL